MPVQLYDAKTGAPTQADAAKAQAGVLDGSLAPKPKDLVHVQLKDGRKGTVEGHELAATLSDGARLLDPDVEHHEQVREEQSGFGGGVGAAVGGAFNGATGGLGLGLVRKGIGAVSPDVGKAFKETVEAQREEHPYATTLGEVAGAAGAAYAAHKSPLMRMAPAAGIDAIGGAVARGVGEAVAGVGGEGALATAGRAAAQSAARASTEGALFAAGSHIGEDILGDHDTAADKLFVATAKGGAFGLGLGGMLGGAGSLIRGARGAASKGGSGILAEAATEATTAAEAKLAAAENAHAEATARSFSYQDMQGTPVGVDARVTNGDITTPVEAENVFKISKGRTQINLGPSEGDAAYKNPHTVESLDNLQYDANGQPIPQKAPKFENPIDFAGLRPPYKDPMSVGTRYQHPDYSLSPSPFKKGIEALEPPAAKDVFDISTDKKVIAENEALRRGTVDKGFLGGAKDQNASLSNALDSEGRPFSMEQAEDPWTKARRSAADKDLAAARKEFEQATQDAEEAVHLKELAAEIKAGDPHKLADRLAWQSTGADAGLTKRVNKFPGGTDRAGATMRRLGILDVAEGEGAVKATLGSFSSNTPEKMLERTETKLSQLVDEMHATGSTKTHATLGELLAPLDEQIAKLEQVSTSVPVANQLRAQRQMLLGTPKFRHLLDVDGNLVPGAESTPVSLSDIIAERRGVGRKAYAVGDVHANIIKESNAGLYAAWDKLEQEALDKVGAGEGAKFKSLKTDITDLINVEKALEGKIARASSARAFGVLPHMAGMAAGNIGGAILPVAGHTIGHALGMMLSKSVMDRGNAAAAVALTKIADIGAVRHLLGTVDNAVGRAAKGLTRVVEAKPGPKLRVIGGSARTREDTKPLAQRYRDATAKLDAMENQGSPVAERALAATQDLAQHAPNVSQSFALAMSRAAAFLSSKRPQPLSPADPFSAREPSILDSDKLAFIRSWDAATNPMGVLDRFERGIVTPEDTEALKAVAPKVYADLQTKVMNEIATRRAAGKPMPFKQRMSLGLLFDTPTDPSLEPATYKALQANVFTPPADAPKPKGGKSNAPRRPVKTLPSPLDGYFDGSKPGRK